MMAAEMHPAAPHHVPFFITSPGQTDVLMLATGAFLVVTVVMLGVFYLKLHALPEHLAHRGQKVQFQIVAVLGLLALFTHNHAFWIAGLLLALIQLPNITDPLSSITRSLETIAGRRSPPDAPSFAGGAALHGETGPSNDGASDDRAATRTEV
jgi:hypothetical protein